MRENALLRPFSLPLSSTKIGRFLCNVETPLQDSLDPEPHPELSVIEKVQTNYSGSESVGNSRSFSSDLTVLLSTWISTRTETAMRVTTSQVKTYHVDNSGRWFREAVQLEQVRRWMGRVIDEG